MTLDERIEFLTQSIESHDRHIGELTDSIATQARLTNRHIGELTDNIATQARQIRELTGNVATLVRVSNQDATAIRTLARLADIHEKRISDLEGGHA
jgi:uncharacterized coiled-coil protein SlyX